MKINIFPIVSSLHAKERISKDTQALLDELEKNSKHDFSVVDINQLYEADLALILIQSGGSEQLFLENFDKLKPPFYLLTYGHNNSLAASLEILSFLKDNNFDGEVLHGDIDYLLNRIDSLFKSEKCFRYGVIGKPSDWLIASKVNYDMARKIHHIDLIDIDINELIDEYELINNQEVCTEGFEYNQQELTYAMKLKKAIEKLKIRHQLDGFTIRCFSLLDTIKTTACLPFALFNDDDCVSTCEGDIPTMISMHVLKQATGQTGFQANPSKIDIKNGKMILAHCTLPLNMTKRFYLDTHFESGIGVAVKGYLKEEMITVFKLGRNLTDYFVSTGVIVRNLEENNLCRTQVEVEIFGDIKYFLNRPYGNHHVIIYGDYEREIREYMDKVISNV